MRKTSALCIVALLAFCARRAAAKPRTAQRKTVSLDGVWQIAEGELDVPPTKFEREVVVPGLVDMAKPPFIAPGPKVASRAQPAQKDPRRDAYWYRREFTIDGPVRAVGVLKIGKAMFGTRAVLNGKTLGDHPPCFTPGIFDATNALQSGTNELLIRIGADRDAVGQIPSGFDFEKERYIPGIFDTVELILCGFPHIVNLQVAPDLANRQARMRVWVRGSHDGDLAVEVREAKSGKVAGKASTRMKAGPVGLLDVNVPLADCHLWSPEDPFLYEVTARTSSDEFTTRFGMREFKFDPATGRAMLNGKPYFMRGSNITLYRFFEDADRGDLPWRESWVRLLHRRIKDMHWNCLRYCIGFPPELWYRIADEEGILIQDEFPIWYSNDWKNLAKGVTTAELVKEYKEWMQERWNHPCVVVWDASNETTSDETGPAIRQVRELDLSGRPFDNSYMPPALPGDVLEEHPYHFGNPGFKLRELKSANPAPWGKRGDSHGVIINEYGWLWLNRDGTPTTLTKQVYQNLLGANSTTEQRRHLYARYIAAETEFWRAHRTAAAVMHFTALGYSRPDGQTSDHWLDVEKLTWEPEFYCYVRDSFAPVGLMIDAWADDYKPGEQREFPVVIVNDLREPWAGDVRLQILRGAEMISEQKLATRVPGFETTRVVFSAAIPAQAGSYQVEATLLATPTGPVHSLRDFAVLTAEEREARRS